MSAAMQSSQRTVLVPGLTGVRGIAACAVFFCHVQPVVLQVLGIDISRASHFIGNGFRGVDLFFVLSGFILFHVHGVEFENPSRSILGKFFVLRFFRVYPLNTFILLIMAPLPFLAPDFITWYKAAHLAEGQYHARDFGLGAFIQSLLLAQTWTIAKLGTWNEPAWTLSAEVLGYCGFPLLAWFMARQRSVGALTGIALASLAILVVLMVAAGHSVNNPSGLFGAIRMAFCFTSGIALCRLFKLAALPATAAPALTTASTAAIALCLWFDDLGTLAVFGFAGLIYGLALARGPVSRFMSSQPVVFLGKISFSFYMVHIIPLNLFMWVIADRLSALGLGARIAMLAGVALACLGCAMFTYRFVELPFQRLGRRAASDAQPSVASQQTA